MNEEEKYEKAKKKYQNFLNRMTEKEEPIPIKSIACYVTKANGEVLEDYYWSDVEITPTKLYRWLLKYNAQNIPRTEWVVSVRLPNKLYQSVLDMVEVEDDTGILTMDDVLIMSE